MTLSFAPPAPLYLPAMSNIQNLFLAGVDLQDVNYPADHLIFRCVRQLHLHWTRPSSLFIRHLAVLPRLKKLHIGFARVEKIDLANVLNESPSLEEATFSVLMESSKGRMWAADGDDGIWPDGKRLQWKSDFPYHPFGM